MSASVFASETGIVIVFGWSGMMVSSPVVISPTSGVALPQEKELGTSAAKAMPGVRARASDRTAIIENTALSFKFISPPFAVNLIEFLFILVLTSKPSFQVICFLNSASLNLYKKTEPSRIISIYGSSAVSFYWRPAALRPAVARGLPLSGPFNYEIFYKKRVVGNHHLVGNPAVSTAGDLWLCVPRSPAVYLYLTRSLSIINLI